MLLKYKANRSEHNRDSASFQFRFIDFALLTTVVVQHHRLSLVSASRYIMRHLIPAGLGLLAASMVAAQDSGAPPTLLYTVSNFYAYWSLGVVIETSFDVKEKDTNKDIAHCAGKKVSSITSPPDFQPYDVGKCDTLEPGSDVTTTVGGSPGQNFLIYLNNTQTVPCGPEKRYEGEISFSGQFFHCDNLEQNGNSAKCYQNPGAVIDLPLNKYFEGKPGGLRRRNAQVQGC